MTIKKKTKDNYGDTPISYPSTPYVLSIDFLLSLVPHICFVSVFGVDGRVAT